LPESLTKKVSSVTKVVKAAEASPKKSMTAKEPSRLWLQSLDTSTLHERAYQHLKTALMAGLFRPGEVVTLRGVADQLGTSVMPVREAVRRLVSERAFEMPTSRSIRVPRMSREHFDELCRCRVLLEGEAASLAAANISAVQIEVLKEKNQEMPARSAVGDVAGMLAANQAFHFGVYAHSESQLLVSMIETLWLQGGPYLNLLITPQPNEQESLIVGGGYHEDLLDALVRRDAQAARAAIAGDISAAAELYRSRIP